MSYQLTDRAEADLLAILEQGLDLFGRGQALKYREGIERAFELLEQRPRIGRLLTGLTPPVRSWSYHSHMILYDVVAKDEVIILRIRHGREDWQSDPVKG